jgi:GNAT superfamily N-acetyltransferase
MVIRRYSIVKVPSEDAEDVVTDLHSACWPKAGGSYWDPDAEWWLANDTTGGAVAFAGLRASKSEAGAYLCRAGVHPMVRGNGLQRRLIKAREAWARKQGLRFLVTDTVYGNHWSANNLIEEGFRMYNPIAPWGSDDSSYWRKELN